MSKIFGKMVKNERYFLDYFSFLICFNLFICLFVLIHALRVECNVKQENGKTEQLDFNSCIPSGVQPK